MATSFLADRLVSSRIALFSALSCLASALPTGKLLFATNTPDNRLEVYRIHD